MREEGHGTCVLQAFCNSERPGTRACRASSLARTEARKLSLPCTPLPAIGHVLRAPLIQRLAAAGLLSDI
jgi:hypothetical protein